MKIYTNEQDSINIEDDKPRFIILYDYHNTGWKNYIIIDTSKGISNREFQGYYWIKKICECPDKEYAEMICNALNYQNDGNI